MTKDNKLNPEQALKFIELSQEWLMDNKDLGQTEVESMNDNELILELNRFYVGGFDQFLIDHNI